MTIEEQEPWQRGNLSSSCPVIEILDLGDYHQNLNPKIGRLSIPKRKFSRHDRQILIEILDWDRFSKPTSMGYVMTTLALLEQYSRAGSSFDIQVRCATIVPLKIPVYFVTDITEFSAIDNTLDLTSVRICAPIFSHYGIGPCFGIQVGTDN